MENHKGLSINSSANMMIKGYNGIERVNNDKLSHFLSSIQLNNCSEMKLNYEEFMGNLYYNKVQNPPGVSSFVNIFVFIFTLKHTWGILTYIIIKMNFID